MGTDIERALGKGLGVVATDVNNDGLMDLFVANDTVQNFLFINRGKDKKTGKWVWEESALGSEVGYSENGQARSGMGVDAADVFNTGYEDLFVANVDQEMFSLYRNMKNENFKDVARQNSVAQSTRLLSGWGLKFFDYDNDGWPDIYVADDSTPSLLFMNSRDGTFRESGMLAGVAYDANGRTQGGMGADSVDYDGDGLLDIIKTNFSDEMPSLYHNEGKGFFTDVTVPAGLAGETTSVKWGTGFIDFDDDGRPDIVIASGSIYSPGAGTHHQLPKTDSKLILMRNVEGNRFVDISEQAGPAFAASRCSRGAAFGDIFNTGRIDIVLNNLNDYPSLLRNQSPPANRWLLVKLIGTKTNRSAIGSRVSIEAGERRQVQEVRSGGSFCSQSDLRLHFGLGAAKDARVRVRWLGGAEETFERVAVNRLVVIQEGKGIVSQEAF